MDQFDERVDEDSGESAAGSDAALREILAEVIALRQYASHLAAVVADQAGMKLRHAAQRLAVMIGRSIILGALTIAFTVYLVIGIDGALVALVGRPWLGHLLTGGLGLGTLALIGTIGRVGEEWLRMRRETEKYERRKAQQRATVGRDIDQAVHATA